MERDLTFCQFADAVPFLFWTATADGTIDYVSQAFLQLRREEGDTLAGWDWTRAIHPDDLDRGLGAWREAVAGGERLIAELRMHCRPGGYRWHQVNGIPIRNEYGKVSRWYGTVNDIDDHKSREEDLQRLSDRLSSTLESIATAFYTVDQEWRITYLNGEFEAWLKRPKAELLGRNIWELFPHLVGTTIDGEFRQAMENMAATKFVQHFPLVNRWVEVHAYPWAGGLSVYLNDVTAQRAIDEKMRQSQRLEAVGQLTGGIAHDFNNLLTIILGSAEMLAENLTADEELHSVAELALDSAERGAELTKRLLSFSRQMPLEPRAADIDRLLLGMDSLLRRTLGEHVEIEIVRKGGPWMTMADVSQLENALLNLCINARDAMPEGGKLTIETGNVQLDADTINGDSEIVPGDYVMIAVSDNGTGMEPDVAARVFEPFFTTKPVGQGSGLGLSMVYGFIRQSNGYVRIYSHPAEGTTVKLYLPRAAQEEDPEMVSSGDVDIPHGSERILVVEDEEIVRKHVSAQLGRLGYDVVTASDGPEALRILEEVGRFDLLFTDVVMPGGMSGRELAEAARIMRPDMPVLFTSGYTENAFVRSGRLEAGIHLLSKPYRRQELAEKLRTVLATTPRVR